MSIWTNIFGKPKPKHVHDWTVWADHCQITNDNRITAFVQMRQCTECKLKDYSKISIWDMEKKK